MRVKSQNELNSYLTVCDSHHCFPLSLYQLIKNLENCYIYIMLYIHSIYVRNALQRSILSRVSTISYEQLHARLICKRKFKILFIATYNKQILKHFINDFELESQSIRCNYAKRKSCCFQKVIPEIQLLKPFYN